MEGLLNTLGITQAQVASAVRWILATGGAWLVNKGLVTTDQVQMIVGAGLALFPLIWSLAFTHTQRGQINAVKLIPGVRGIVADYNVVADHELGGKVMSTFEAGQRFSPAGGSRTIAG